jgi:hypothetical protein
MKTTREDAEDAEDGADGGGDGQDGDGDVEEGEAGEARRRTWGRGRRKRGPKKKTAICRCPVSLVWDILGMKGKNDDLNRLELWAELSRDLGRCATSVSGR